MDNVKEIAKSALSELWYIVKMNLIVMAIICGIIVFITFSMYRFSLSPSFDYILLDLFDNIAILGGGSMALVGYMYIAIIMNFVMIKKACLHLGAKFIVYFVSLVISYAINILAMLLIIQWLNLIDFANIGQHATVFQHFAEKFI